VAKLERWVATLVARLLAMQLSGFETRHLSKIHNGRHKQRSGRHTLYQKNISFKMLIEKKVSAGKCSC
jgi:hypothetical protein